MNRECGSVSRSGDRGSASRSHEHGSASIEAIIIIPVFVLFLLMIVAVARVATSQADVHAALVQGVRTALSEATSAAGEDVARRVIITHLANEGVACSTTTITIDMTALDLSGGVHGAVSASLECVVSLGDLTVPGLPGRIIIEDSFTTPVDPYAR